MTERLLSLRNSIDKLDSDLLSALQQRFEVVREVGTIKERGFYVGRPIREAQQLAHWLTTHPELPFATLQAILRNLVTTALMMEADDFTIHVDAKIDNIATTYYPIAPKKLHHNAASLLEAHQSQLNHSISIIPCDDVEYLRHEMVGKQLFIIEALPYDSAEKQAFVLANLPDKYIPHQHLFFCDDADNIPATLGVSVFKKLAEKTIYHLPSTAEWQNAQQPLSGLAIGYLGGYSDDVLKAIRAS